MIGDGDRSASGDGAQSGESDAKEDFSEGYGDPIPPKNKVGARNNLEDVQYNSCLVGPFWGPLGVGARVWEVFVFCVHSSEELSIASAPLWRLLRQWAFGWWPRRRSNRPAAGLQGLAG